MRKMGQDWSSLLSGNLTNILDHSYRINLTKTWKDLNKNKKKQVRV
jgi:hypothetical protein